MIAAIVLAAAVAVGPPAPTPAPSASPARLPTIEQGLAIPYPAYGTPQPQIVTTRTDPNVSPTVSLDEATSIAIMRSPTLAQARAEVDLESASVLSAKTALNPSLSASGSSTYEYQQSGATSTSGAGSTTGASSTTGTTGSSGAAVGGTGLLYDSASLSLSQLIFDGGVVRAKIDAASLTRDATVATYRRDAQNVAYTVATNYYQLLQDQRAVAVDNELVNEYVVSENLVRAQIRAGTTAGSDLAQQTSTTAQARSTLVQAQGTMQTDRVAFATALGLDADIDVLPRDDTQGLDTATPPLTLAPFAAQLAVALVERPDLDEANLSERSSEASLRAARRGLSPSISLAATKGLASTSIGGGSFRNDGTVGFTVDIPIYDQGVTHANIASGKANVAIANAGVASTRLTVQQDVREALIAIVSDRASLDSTRAAYDSAVTSLRSTQGQYRAGVTTLPSLIQAETTLSSAATNIVNAIYKSQLAQVNLRYAVGTILQ